MNTTSGSRHFEIPEIGPPNRRSSARFPLQEPLTYRIKHSKHARGGAGTCLNISSGGILFTTPERLLVGWSIEVSMNWPALLHGACPLKFVATGPVVRTEDGRAAIRIDRYEFRTRATQPRLETVPPVAIQPRA
jgi:hypothetical protein